MKSDFGLNILLSFRCSRICASHPGLLAAAKMGVNKYLGIPRFRYGTAEEKDKIGITTGLAWTEVGGELLVIEVATMPGKGKLSITGKLGDVMKESAQAAMSYVRSRAAMLGLSDELYHQIYLFASAARKLLSTSLPGYLLAL